MSTLAFEEIAAKVAEGRQLADAEAEQLASSYDIISLGMLADDLRRQRHRVRTTFVRVAELATDAARAGLAALPPAAREVRLVGAFPGLGGARAIVRDIAARAEGAPVTAFSLAALEQAVDGDGALVREWVEALAADGLSMVDEAPIDALRDPEAMVRAVIDAGLQVGRVTVGSPQPGGPLAAIRRAARLHEATGGVRVFAPIPRRPGAEPTTGYEDVRGVALARILLPAVPHIQADWRLHGPKLAQVALTFGVDDLDNVSPSDEAAEGRRRAPLEDVRRNIRAAGLEPIERDLRFAVVA